MDEKERVTEEEVFFNSLKVVRETDRLVIADFGPRNVERLLTFLEIARITGRKLLILPKDAYLLHSLNSLSPEYPSPDDPSILIYRKAKGREQGWERLIDELYPNAVSPRDVGKNEGDFILCFSFWDINELPSIKPKGGIYIYSSSEPHNEEERIDMERLARWLERFDIKGVGFSGDERGFHSSGHALGREIIEMAREIKPKYLIPVHTEKPEVFLEELSETEIIIPERGKTIEIRG